MWDLYLWLLKDNMTKMQVVPNLSLDKAKELGSKWVDKNKGDFLVVETGKTIWNHDPIISIISEKELNL